MIFFYIKLLVIVMIPLSFLMRTSVKQSDFLLSGLLIIFMFKLWLTFSVLVQSINTLTKNNLILHDSSIFYCLCRFYCW